MQRGSNKHKGKKPKLGTGLSLEKFAKAKSSQYDKKRKAETQANLAAKKVNKYRKLKARLQKSGSLQPFVALEREATEERIDADRDRILARAGPAPDDSDEDPESTTDDEEEQQPHPVHDEGRFELEHTIAARQQGTLSAPEQPLEPQEQDLMVDKKGKKRKGRPLSQIQRIAASVQADKNAKQKAREEAAAAAAARKARQEEIEKHRKQQTKLFRKKTRRGQPVMKFRVEKVLEQLQRQQQ